MQLGMIGLGRMGANMVRRLMRAGHHVVVHDRSAAAVETLDKEGATGAGDLTPIHRRPRPAANDLRDAAGGRRGRDHRRSSSRCSTATTRSSTAATPTITTTFAGRRRCRPKGLHYVDMGTSGGVWGLERGYCLMIGGESAVVKRLDPIFAALAPGRGDIPSTPGTRRPRRHGRARLSPLRSGRSRPLREDGAQRHRVRVDGRVRRRAQHPASTPTSARDRTTWTPRRHRCDTPSTISTTSISPTSPRSGGAAASSRRGCWISRPRRWRATADARTLRRPGRRFG